MTATANEPARTQANEARRSIRYMTDVALRYGKVNDISELLDQIVAFSQYKPFQALLVLLQRPAATHVLPAHRWEEDYGYVVRFNEQPLVLLQPGGPVMFMFDISQVEPGPHAALLPPMLRNPFRVGDIDSADSVLNQLIENAVLDGVRVSDAGLGIRFAGCATRCTSAAAQTVRGFRLSEPPQKVPVRFDVLLNRSHSVTEQLITLAHELGHIYCGHLGEQSSDIWAEEMICRNRQRLSHEQDELEANTVARVVLGRLAPDLSQPDALQRALAGDVELPSDGLEVVLTTAGRIIDMTRGFAPQRPHGKRRLVAARP